MKNSIKTFLFIFGFSNALSGEFKNLGFEVVNLDQFWTTPFNTRIGMGNVALEDWTIIAGLYLDQDNFDIVFNGPFWANVMYDHMYMPNGELVMIFDSHNVNHEVEVPVIGRYSLYFISRADFVIPIGPGNDPSGYVVDAVSQTGNIPSHIQSVLFMNHMDPMAVYINDQRVESNFLFSNRTESITVAYWGADISKWSGQEVTLRFVTHAPPRFFTKHVLDDIHFSPEPLNRLIVELKYFRENGQFKVDWGGPGSEAENRRLQVSAFSDGPWETILNAENPYSIPESEIGGLFYRAVREDPRR